MRFLRFLSLAAILASISADDPIRKVYVLWSNHLDVGYTDNTGGSSAGSVVNRYFHDHFPTAIKTAAEARKAGKFNYTWMAHSWLVNTFRNCEATKINTNFSQPSDIVCPNATQIADFDAAVRRGDITWHAFPFNAEPEMLDQTLFDASINMTFAEDDYYGHKHRRTLSQRDVPGLTRNVIPLLNKRGIVAISVGENSQCAPFQVPPIFLWRDNTTDTEVVALFHALGYGRRRRSENEESYDPLNDKSKFYIDTNGDVIATDLANPWDDGPGMHVQPDGYVDANRAEHCVEVAAAGVAICYAWRPDNTGPQSYSEAELIYDAVTLLFPKATVVSSDAFDDFIEDVLPYKNSLPVVTAELGDTWMMGANADPLKVAQYRAASRAYRTCHKDGSCLDGAPPGSEAKLDTFVRQLITVSEHTWGWNGGHLRKGPWDNEAFKYNLKTDDQYRTSILTWDEQRNFIRNAVAALPESSKLSKDLAEEFALLEPHNKKFDPSGFTEVVNFKNRRIMCGKVTIIFDTDGSAKYIQTMDNQVWADEQNRLFRVHYQNPDKNAIHAYARDYIAGVSDLDPDAFAENLVKPNYNMPEISANATLSHLYVSGDGNKVLLELTMPSEAHSERGAPSELQALLTCDGTQIDYSLRIFDKTASRVPEALWFSNNPSTYSKMTMDKLGIPMDPLDADLNCDGHRNTCGVHLHGVGDEGICVDKLRMVSVDSALVSIGIASPFPTPLRVPKLSGGVHFALIGNTWNTNYPFWYPFHEEDASSQFRFKFTFGPSCTIGH